MKKIKVLLLIGLSVLISACGKEEPYEPYKVKETYTVSSEKTNYVLIEMKTKDQILIELYPDIAPITVANFQKLVGEKFYDKTTFHRVISGFMIQAGRNSKIEADTIKGEFDKNDVANSLKHERGVISMARTLYDYDSASSEFFIMHKDTASLNGDYAAFGRVIDGLETVDRIAAVEVDGEYPVDPPVVNTIRFVSIVEKTDKTQ